MVMCVGGREYHCGSRKSASRCRTSIVYFPSQDAITASVIPRGVNMWGSGTKRKLEVAETEENQQSYFDQRQSILNISMIKLRTQPIRKVEQPLRRSVLIFNTLKHIETELKVEGVRWNLPTKPSLLPSLEPSKDDTLDAIPADCTLAEHKSMSADRLACSHGGLAGSRTSNCVSMDVSPSVTSIDSSVSVSTSTPSDSCGVSTSTSPDLCPSVSSVPSSMSIATPDSSSLFSGGSDTRSIDSLFSLTSQQGPLPTFSSLLDLDSCSSSSPSSLSSSTSSSSSLLSSSTSSSSASSSASSPNLPASSSILNSCSSLSSSSPSWSSSHTAQHSTCRLSSAAHGSSQTPFSSQSISGHCQTMFKSFTASQSSSSSSSSTDQDVFNDFDFSSLDIDFFSIVPNNLKLPSLSAEDLQSLPHPETFPPSLSSSCNPKHNDIIMEDLDSIMQILVGI